jgi:hypothetical protein
LTDPITGPSVITAVEGSWPERYGIQQPIAHTFTGQLIQPMQASHATVTIDRPGAATGPVVKSGEANGGAPPGPRAQSTG